MASPLIIGASLTEITEWDLETYSNEKVIAVNQDPLGIQGRPVYSDCPGKPYAPLEQASPTTFPLNITPWTWSRALLRQWTVVSMCIFAVFLLSFVCLVQRCRVDAKSGSTGRMRANNSGFSILNAQENGTGSSTSSAISLDAKGAVGTPYADGVSSRAGWRCMCRSCVLIMGSASLAMFAVTVWLFVVLSWGVDPCVQVWAKPLVVGTNTSKIDKRVAMAFVNYDSGARTVRCDSACLAEAGFKEGDVLDAEDLWGGGAPSKISEGGIECELKATPGGGSSCMLVVSRKYRVHTE